MICLMQFLMIKLISKGFRDLKERFQELSMELLGTKNGSIPGPTAAKAEIAYAAQLAAAANKEKVGSFQQLLKKFRQLSNFLSCRVVPRETA